MCVKNTSASIYYISMKKAEGRKPGKWSQVKARENIFLKVDIIGKLKFEGYWVSKYVVD